MDERKEMHFLEHEPIVYIVPLFLNDEDCASYFASTKYIFQNYDTTPWWQNRCKRMEWSKRAIKKSNHFLRLAKQNSLHAIMTEITHPEQLAIVEHTIKQFHEVNMKLVIAILKFTDYHNIERSIVKRLKRIDRIQSIKTRILLKFSLQSVQEASFYKIFTNCEHYAKIIGSFYTIDHYLKNYEAATNA